MKNISRVKCRTENIIYKLIVITLVLVGTIINTKNALINTVFASISMIILAVYIGKYTNLYSEYVGEKRGGLLSATLGNLPELAMGIWSLGYGMVSMVKWALIGSIISNMLLVLGISSFVGGVKYKEQSFNKNIARTNFNMLTLALASMILLATVNYYVPLSSEAISSISNKVAIVLIFVYGLGLIFSLVTHSNLFVVSEDGNEVRNENKDRKIRILSIILILSLTLFFSSENVINNLNELVKVNGVSENLLGILVVPFIGNIGENISAIMAAFNDKINMSIEIAVGSSIQIALFVTPIIMVLSYTMGITMNLLFSPVQIIIALVAVAMSFIVYVYGKSYWFEGAILLAIYLMSIISCYYII